MKIIIIIPIIFVDNDMQFPEQYGTVLICIKRICTWKRYY